MIDFVKTHPFNYSPYQDDTVIVGAKGKGKSTKGKQILTTIPNIPYWVWDYSNQFNGFGHLVHRIEDLQYGQYVIQASDKSKENYGRFLDKAFQLSNLTVVTDELHQYTHKNEIFQPLYHFVLSGRNKGLNSIFMTTRTQSVPNYILENIEHVFVFKLGLKGSIDWLEDYIGSAAWLLLSKDKRKNYFIEPEYPDVLPDYSYIYRCMSESKPYVVVP